MEAFIDEIYHEARKQYGDDVEVNICGGTVEIEVDGVIVERYDFPTCEESVRY